MSGADCGTYAGWNQHQKLGEPACPACREAARLYRRSYRKRGLCVPGLGWPLGPGDVAPARPSEINWDRRHEAWAVRKAERAS